MPIGTSNKVERQNQQDRAAKTPGFMTLNHKPCVIIKAYDPDVINTETLPEYIMKMIIANPGTLYALVRLDNGREYFLPFRASEASILISEGNSVLLKGRKGVIIYFGQRITKGTIELTGEPKRVFKTSVGAEVCNISGVC